MKIQILTFALIVGFTTAACAQPKTVYPNGKRTQKGKLPKVTYRESSTQADPDDYKDFGREVKQTISKMKEVAVGNKEKSDMRALEFLLRDYNEAVKAKDWKRADYAKERMNVSLVRGGEVASDAGRRKAEWARADAERRHQEELQQQERQHREEMSKLEQIRQQQWQLELLRRR